jgi:probable rRNA maturation factor
MDDNEIAELHEAYLADPTPTDVITFPGDPAMEFAGEICVSVDHALAHAKTHGQTFQEELTLYLVHGWLHLAGLNDIEESDRRKMRQAEASIMAALRQAGVIPNFTLTSDKAVSG